MRFISLTPTTENTCPVSSARRVDACQSRTKASQSCEYHPFTMHGSCWSTQLLPQCCFEYSSGEGHYLLKIPEECQIRASISVGTSLCMDMFIVRVDVAAFSSDERHDGRRFCCTRVKMRQAVDCQVSQDVSWQGTRPAREYNRGPGPLEASISWAYLGASQRRVLAPEAQRT